MRIYNNIKSSFYKTLQEVELVKVLLKSVLSLLCLPIPPQGLWYNCIDMYLIKVIFGII
jgi:hypothetical protein